MNSHWLYHTNILMYDGEHRPLILIILFSIISVGFFNFYWLYIATYEIKQVSADSDKIKPVVETFLAIITAGLYIIYWSYKYNKLLSEAQRTHKMTPQDVSLPAAIFSLPVLTCIGMCFTQYQLNRLWKYGTAPEAKKKRNKKK